MTPDEIKNMKRLHELWIKGKAGGIRANLQGVDLQEADLQRANLQEANLRGAYLRGANLQETNLWGVQIEEHQLKDLAASLGVKVIIKGEIMRIGKDPNSYVNERPSYPNQTRNVSELRIGGLYRRHYSLNSSNDFYFLGNVDDKMFSYRVSGRDFKDMMSYESCGLKQSSIGLWSLCWVEELKG